MNIEDIIILIVFFIIVSIYTVPALNKGDEYVEVLFMSVVYITVFIRILGDLFEVEII